MTSWVNSHNILSPASRKPKESSVPALKDYQLVSKQRQPFKAILNQFLSIELFINTVCGRQSFRSLGQQLLDLKNVHCELPSAAIPWTLTLQSLLSIVLCFKFNFNRYNLICESYNNRWIYYPVFYSRKISYHFHFQDYVTLLGRTLLQLTLNEYDSNNAIELYLSVFILT